MFNQKGFTAAPLVILVVISLVAAAVTYKEGSIQINPNGNQGIPGVSDNLTNNQQPTPTPFPSTSSSDLINPVKQFYSDLSAKQYFDAWTLLSKNFQNYAQSYNNFVDGYNSTTSITIKDVSLQDLSNYTVYVQLDSTNNINGQIRNNSYAGTWKLIHEDGSWKLNEAKIEALNPINPTQTGKVIDHYDVTTGKTISIYENELLPYTRKGKQLYLTQADIDWFEKMDNIDAAAQVSINQANAEIDRIDRLNDKYNAEIDSIKRRNSNSGYTHQYPESTPYQAPAYKPYYNSPSNSYNPPYVAPATTIPPSSIVKPANSQFNIVFPDGMTGTATKNPYGNDNSYTFKTRVGETFQGHCYTTGQTPICGP